MSTGCPCNGPDFVSQHPHGDPQLCNSRFRGSDALCWPLSALDTHSVHLQLVGKALISQKEKEQEEEERKNKEKGERPCFKFQLVEAEASRTHSKQAWWHWGCWASALLLPGWHCTSRHREKFWQAFPMQGFRANSCVQVSCRRWEMLVWTKRRHSGRGWEQGWTGHHHVTPESPPTHGPDMQRTQSQRAQVSKTPGSSSC